MYCDLFIIYQLNLCKVAEAGWSQSQLSTGKGKVHPGQSIPSWRRQTAINNHIDIPG